jgi:hypothetical protein
MDGGMDDGVKGREMMRRGGDLLLRLSFSYLLIS